MENAFYFKTFYFIFGFTHLHEFCTYLFDDLFSNRIIKNLFLFFISFLFLLKFSWKFENFLSLHINVKTRVITFNDKKIHAMFHDGKVNFAKLRVSIDEKTRISGLFRWHHTSSTFYSLSLSSFSLSFSLISSYSSLFLCLNNLLLPPTHKIENQRSRKFRIFTVESVSLFGVFSSNLIAVLEIYAFSEYFCNFLQYFSKLKSPKKSKIYCHN